MKLLRLKPIVIEISGAVATLATVLGYLGVSPSLPPSQPTATPTPTVLSVSAPASSTATPNPATTRVPSLIGLKEDQAKRLLEASGLRLGKVTQQAVAGVADGTIAAQQPQAGLSVPRGGSVDIAVADRDADRKRKHD